MANLDEFLRQKFPQANPEEGAASPVDLRSSLMQAQQHEPDAYARATRLAADKSIPVDTVLQNLPKLEQQAEVEALDPSRLSPGLADWLKDPKNLAVARDDIGVLDTLAGAYRAARGGMTEGFEQTELGSLAFREWAGRATPEELTRIDQLERTMEARQREAEATGVADSTGLTALREAGKMLPQMARTVAAGAAVGGAGAATGAGVALVAGQMGPQVATPEEVVTVPAAAATGFGIGFRAGSAAESFQQETAFAFREFKKLTDETGKPMDPAVARAAAAGVGAVNAGLEAFGLSLVLKTIPGGDKLLGKFTKDAVKQALKQRTVREALTQVAKRYGTAVSGEALTEMVQETVAILGREIAQASDDGTYAPDAVGQDVSRVFEAGKAALLGTAVISGAGSTVQAVGEVQQARKAQETRETLNTLVGAAEQSKLRGRLPEKFREYLDKAQKGEPTENLYFNQDAFDAAAERMGVDGRSLYAGIVGSTVGYDEAVATGGNVVMPTAAYLEKVTGTRVHDEIAPDAKFSIDDLSEREAQEQGGEMKAVQDMADELKAAGDGMDPETRKVYDHFFGQLEGGQYDRAAAEDQAAIATAMVSRLAKRSGMSVDEILGKYGLDVRSTLPRVLREKPAEIDTQLYPLIDRLRAGDIPSERDVFGPTLLDFIRDRGGLKDEGGELSARDMALWDKENRKPGQRSFMGPQGRDLDDMAEQAVEAGYMFERDPNKLLDLIDREIAGSPVFSTAHSVDGKIAEMKAALESLDEYLSREGVDLKAMDNAAVKSLIETGKLPEAAAQEDAGTEFDQFAGQNALTADIARLDQAKAMAAKGASASAILYETGWQKGVDGRWRFEISDDKAKLKEVVVDMAAAYAEAEANVTYERDGALFKALYKPGTPDYIGTFGRTEEDAFNNMAKQLAKRAGGKPFKLSEVKDGDIFALGDVLDHPDLYAAYPYLSSMGVEFNRGGNPAERGAFFERGNRIEINADRSQDEILSTMLHEIQHAIQAREDFARGGNSDTVFTKSVVEALKAMSEQEARAVEQWKAENKDVLENAERASELARNALKYEAAERLLSYSERDKPSGVFRLIRNEMQWIYSPDFRLNNPEAADLQRRFYGMPKRGEKRNAYIRDMAFDAARVIRNSIPPEQLALFKADTRTVKSMVKALGRQSDKARAQLRQLRNLESKAAAAEHVVSQTRYKSPYDVYRALAGEIEARATQARQKLTPDERRDRLAKYDADVSPAEAIVVVGGHELLIPEGALNQTAGLPEPEVVLNQPAYHGSPYRFDKFSLEHLGKGEGAQAYGWGLYFAGKREVADWYRKNLSKFDIDLPAGVFPQAENLARRFIEGAEGDKNLAVERLQKNTVDNPKVIKQAISAVKKAKVGQRGQLYRVEIPSDDQYLLWDKPLSEQSEKVRAAIERAMEDSALDEYSRTVLKKGGVGAAIYEALKVDDNLGNTAEAASKYLHGIGIPGIKYLDGTSRGAGDGSYNYVIFDDNAVQIAETYYQKPEAGDRLGYIKIAPNRRLSITLLANANMSTFQHEMAHAYLEMLRDLVSGPNVTPELQADWQTIREWLGVDGDTITVDQHEQFARGWEAYLMEGNTPSITLGRAFARMKSWMLKIYRQMRNLNVNLNDDVRGVFDRMIAAEDEIAVARKAQGYAALFADAEQMGVSQREFEAYQRAVQDDLQAGVDRLQRDVMDELARERRQWWLEERTKVQADVEAEVDADPGYGALSFIRRKGGTKLDRKALVDEFGEPFVKNLPRGLYAREGGSSPASVAALFEFESTSKLLEALVRADSMPRDQYVKAETDRRMKEAHGDMLNDGSLPERATVRIHNEKRADVLQFELRALKRKQRETAGIVRAARQSDREMARAAMATVPETRVFREAARLAIAGKALRNIRPYDYLLAERKASRESTAALAAGRYDDAAKAKERELVSHYMYLEAQKAKDEGEKILEHARRQMKAKRQQWLGKAGGDYLEQMNALLDTYEFRNVSGREVRRREGLAEFAARKAAEGTPIDVPLAVLRRSGMVNYADVPLSELRGVMDSMQMIEHLAGLKNDLLYNKDRRDFGVVRDEVVDSVRKNNKDRIRGQFAEDSGLDAVRKHGRSVASIVLQPGTLARALDGGDRMGPLSRHVVDPVGEAETSFLIRRRDEGAKVEKILAVYTPAERKQMATERLDVPGFPKGEGPTRWQAITLALNWGNEGNRQAVLDSRDPNGGTLWDEGRVKAVLDSLDERDWQFVQDVWGYVNSFWPEIAEAQKRRTGIAPKKVDGLPVATRFGVIQGAYYPLKYDARGSWAVSADEAATAFDAMRAGRTAHAYTPNGHTKERVGSGGRPVKLDIGVLGQHVDSVLRDLEMADAINSAWRVLHDREVLSALSASDNMDAITGFELWLQDTAVGEMVSGNSLMTGLRRVRTGFTAAVMLFNVANAALNLAGIGQSFVVIGKKHMARGALQMLKGPLYGENNIVKQVMDLSPVMRIRLDTYNKDVNDHIRSLQGRGDWREKMVQWGYVPSMATQIVVDTTTWLGAYERAKAEGLEGDAAVQFADRLTEDAQSSGRFGQRTSLERGTIDRNVRQTELARVWTALLSYMLNKANRAYERTRATDFKSPAEVLSWTSDMAILYAVEAVLYAAVKGNLPDDEDEDDGEMDSLDWAAWAAKETGKSVLGSLPFIRDGASAVQGFGGGGVIGSFWDSIGRSYQQIEQGEIDASLVKSVNMAGGILFGYPAAQINKFITALSVEADGKDVPVWQYVTGVPLKDR